MCEGYLVVLEQDGIDTETVYLYDATTRALVEVAQGGNQINHCIASATCAVIAADCLDLSYSYGWFGVCATDAGHAGVDDAEYDSAEGE
jgi:hypothetical protein